MRAIQPCRAENDVLCTWSDIVTGQWSVVDLFESRRRHYFVLQRNEPNGQAAHRLTERERQAVRGVSLGWSNKYLAYELGVSESSVSHAVMVACVKLGVDSRLDLLRLMRCLRSVDASSLRLSEVYLQLSCSVSESALPGGLTRSEGCVFCALVAGLSNSEIATLRGRSSRTIANQVASVFRKLNTSSRGELFAKFVSVAV